MRGAEARSAQAHHGARAREAFRSLVLVALGALALIGPACSSGSGTNAGPSDAGTLATDADAGAFVTDDAGAEAGAPLHINCEAPSRITPFPQNQDAPFRALSPAKYQFGRCELVALIVEAANDIRGAVPTASAIGVADLSQEDGQIPGTDVGAPRHPAPSHSNGFSVDLTYFRKDGRTLEDSPACPSKTREFCEGPHDVDVMPTAQLFALLARTERLVQIIIDPMMEADLAGALETLAKTGTPGAAIASKLLTSGIPFHADHFHVSVSRACYDGRDNDGDGKTDLDDPSCTDALDDDESK